LTLEKIFIGRQPIFDQNLNIYAYELLFRGSGESYSANVVDGDSATSTVLLNAFVDMGLDKIVGSHMAFINLTRVFISNPDLIVAPPDQIVLEILEEIEPSEQILDTLKTLKLKGHTIALDDFVYHNKYEPFIDLADIIKLDIMALDEAQIREQAAYLKRKNIRLLGEKIETYEEFEFLKSLDFDLYQGYFFSRPTIVQGRAIAPNQLKVLELIAKINNPDISIEELAQLVSTDISLSHKVMKFINSPMSGLRAQVDSIQQALVLLGLVTIKNWVTILALATGSSKPRELTTTALVRARCCEMMAKKCSLPKPESFFTIGLFSALDAIMDQPLEELLKELPLSDDSKAALLQHQGVYGEALNCTLAMEKGDYDRIGFCDLALADLSDIYLDAINWADNLFITIN
jgi:c-di-GMP phosphodiesterase